MSLDDPNREFLETEIGEAFESVHPSVKTATVRSTRKKVSVTVSGALADFQSTLLGIHKHKIGGVSCKKLGNDITVISANTTREQLIEALQGQVGVIVLEDYDEATEKVA